MAAVKHIVLFGATGDLAARHLIPSLARLKEAGKLPEGLPVLGLGRKDWDDDGFRRFAEASLECHAQDVSAGSKRLLEALQFCQADVWDAGSLAKALGALRGPTVCYLALPPGAFAATIEALVQAGIPEGSRVVVEKPFGENLGSARKLNRLLREAFPEDGVFRVDHFLHWQPVRSLLSLRFANRMFEPVWNREHVERVEITWDETLSLEGRAGYYDATGALKDMVQNHLLQALCLVAMEAPSRLDQQELRDRKVEALRAVKSLSSDEVACRTVRARYGAGWIGDRKVPAYVHEKGVDPRRGTETFVEVRLEVDNDRWRGVPFILRTGKALAEDRGEIVVRFRPACSFSRGLMEAPRPNALKLRAAPDRVSLSLNIGGPADPTDPAEVELRAELVSQDPPVYASLLLAVLEGDPTFFVRADEAEESWRIVEPILDAWKEGRVPLLEYPAGSHNLDQILYPPNHNRLGSSR